MNTCVLLIIPLHGTTENLRERLRECISALRDSPEAASAIAPKPVQDETLPFWTVFLPNPLPPPKA